MRLVREFAFLVALLSLAAVPVIGIGCNDQAATKPYDTGGPTVGLGKKADPKPSTPKAAKKKGRPSDESGSTTGSLGVKPPKAPADNTKN